MASLSTSITPTTVLVALVVIGSLSLMLTLQMWKVKSPLQGVKDVREKKQENQQATQSNKRSEERDVERERREEERKQQEEEKERIELVLKKMNMTLEQVRGKTPEQKEAFTDNSGRLGFGALVLEKMKSDFSSPEVQAVGLNICTVLANSSSQVAVKVASKGVPSIALRAAIDAEGEASKAYQRHGTLVKKHAESCLRAISLGSTADGAADRVWETLSVLKDEEEFIQRWRWLVSLCPVVVDKDLLREKLVAFGYSTATQLKAASFTATQLKAASFTATEMKEASFTLMEINANFLFSLAELKSAFTLAELMQGMKVTKFAVGRKVFSRTANLPTLGCTMLLPKGYGIEKTSAEFARERYCTVETNKGEILKCKFDQLLFFPVSELHEASFTLTELKDFFSLSELLAASVFTLTELKAVFTLAELAKIPGDFVLGQKVSLNLDGDAFKLSLQEKWELQHDDSKRHNDLLREAATFDLLLKSSFGKNKSRESLKKEVSDKLSQYQEIGEIVVRDIVMVGSDYERANAGLRGGDFGPRPSCTVRFPTLGIGEDIMAKILSPQPYFTCSEFKNVGFTLSEMQAANITLHRLKDTFSLTELKAAGFSAHKLKTAIATLSPSDLKQVGFTLSQLKGLMFTKSELVAADCFSLTEFHEAGFVDLRILLQKVGTPWTVAEFKEGGYSAKKFRKSFSPAKMRELGFTLSNMVQCDTQKSQDWKLYLEAGFSESELRATDLNPPRPRPEPRVDSYGRKQFLDERGDEWTSMRSQMRCWNGYSFDPDSCYQNYEPYPKSENVLRLENLRSQLW